jgi:hypothetical protein
MHARIVLVRNGLSPCITTLDIQQRRRVQRRYGAHVPGEIPHLHAEQEIVSSALRPKHHLQPS